MPREQEGRETAGERYDRLHAAGEYTGWSGYCTVPDYCTRPCIDCGAIERRQREEPWVKERWPGVV